MKASEQFAEALMKKVGEMATEMSSEVEKTDIKDDWGSIRKLQNDRKK